MLCIQCPVQCSLLRRQTFPFLGIPFNYLSNLDPFAFTLVCLQPILCFRQPSRAWPRMADNLDWGIAFVTRQSNLEADLCTSKHHRGLHIYAISKSTAAASKVGTSKIVKRVDVRSKKTIAR